MRPEIREYNMDWMLSSIMMAASKTNDGSEKEYRRLLDYIPYFRGILDPIMSEGKPGMTFLKLFSDYLQNIVEAHDKGKKVAMTTFCFSPSILYSLGIVPVTLEVLSTFAALMWKRGSADYLDYCTEMGLTETACSAQRGSLGAYLAGLGAQIDMVVCDTPGVCDTNANAFAFAASYLDKPYYQLNYPQTLTDNRTSTYHLDDYKGMIAFLEDNTGNKLDIDHLRGILKEIKIQDQLVADLDDMHRLVPTPLPVLYNLFIYAGRFMFAGYPQYTRLLQEMIAASAERAKSGVSGLKSGKEKLRVFMCYIDHYSMDLKFFDWLDRQGIAHLGGILSRTFRDNSSYLADLPGSGYAIDTADFESLINSVAQMNARMPMIRSIRGPYDRPGMVLDETLALAKMFKVECIIYNGTPGCRNTWGFLKPFTMDLEKHGYPTHIMNTDAFDERVESWEATVERLSEFFTIRGLL